MRSINRAKFNRIGTQMKNNHRVIFKFSVDATRFVMITITKGVNQQKKDVFLIRFTDNISTSRYFTLCDTNELVVYQYIMRMMRKLHVNPKDFLPAKTSSIVYGKKTIESVFYKHKDFDLHVQQSDFNSVKFGD